jgi:eukaryotic-like serine/threonine-protein kinase
VDSVLTVGRYGIDEWLASGATGVVFRGYDPVLDRPVAIKILRRELAKGSATKGSQDRFKRRARTAGRLFHPNIIAILDFGEDHEVPYLVTEYVDGSRLDRLLEISGAFATRRGVTITLQVLSALKFSHENGVVHLALKPSGVLIAANDLVKVADFGIALIDAAEPKSIGDVMEAGSCMAPEQLSGAPVDHRTDLFAAGALLFEMLTGSKPFRGESISEIVAQMETGGPEDVCFLNPAVPSGLRSVISTALAYDPGQRFATAGAFSNALSAAVSIAGGAEAVTRQSPSEARLGAWSEADEAGWDPETLLIVEGELTRHIGPVARIAVKRAADRATDLVGLYEALAGHIDNEAERVEFLESGLRLSAAMWGRRTPSPPENSTSYTAERGSRPAEPPDTVALDAIEAKLAQYVGPIANILLKQQLQSFKSLPELYRALAEHISDNAERADFLNSARAG